MLKVEGRSPVLAPNQAPGGMPLGIWWDASKENDQKEKITALSNTIFPLFVKDKHKHIHYRGNAIAIADDLFLTAQQILEKEEVRFGDRQAYLCFDGSQEGANFKIFKILNRDLKPVRLSLEPLPNDPIQLFYHRCPENKSYVWFVKTFDLLTNEEEPITADIVKKIQEWIQEAGGPVMSLSTGKVHAIARGQYELDGTPLYEKISDIYEVLKSAAESDDIPLRQEHAQNILKKMRKFSSWAAEEKEE
jgi:hypothetical protein